MIRLVFVFLFGPALASATTYYADNRLTTDCTSGNYSIGQRNCSGSDGKAWNKISSGLSSLRPGDTLYVRGGTYPESFYNTIPSGTSSSPVTIAGYPNETAVLQPPLTSNAPHVLYFEGSSKCYIVIDNMIIDGINAWASLVKMGSPSLADATAGNVAHHIRIKNSEIKNAFGAGANGVLVGAGSHHHEFINLKTHTNGHTIDPSNNLYGYSFYIVGPDNLIEDSDIYNNGAAGIQVYSGYAGFNPDDTIIRNNKIYGNNVKSTAQGRGMALTVTIGNRTQVYNNIIYGNRGGIYVNYDAHNSLLYNNTIYNNPIVEGIQINSGIQGTIVKNNIVSQNGGNITNLGSGTVLSNNLCSVAGTGCTLVGNPLFISTVNKEFGLLQGSPAIDAGVKVSALDSYGVDGMLTDFAKVGRPQGSAYDIGAYEFSQSSASKPRSPMGLQVR